MFTANVNISISNLGHRDAPYFTPGSGSQGSLGTCKEALGTSFLLTPEDRQELPYRPWLFSAGVDGGPSHNVRK